jgi:hypothetical protein
MLSRSQSAISDQIEGVMVGVSRVRWSVAGKREIPLSAARGGSRTWFPMWRSLARAGIIGDV